MHGSIFETPAFRPLPFALSLTAAALLFASWLIPGPVREWWDVADVAFFRFLNGSLPYAEWWRQLWAVGNSHVFDFLSVSLMLWLLFGYVTSEERRHVPERLAVAGVMVATVLIAALLTNVMDAGKRPSPTAALEGAFRLSEHVTWLKTKDISYNSYPSDHGTVLLMMSLMLWHFAGRRAGLIMLAAAAFFTFPRVIGGAHWLTDIAAGSVPLSLAVVALCIYTPLHRYLAHGLMRLLQMPLLKDVPRLISANNQSRRNKWINPQVYEPVRRDSPQSPLQPLTDGQKWLIYAALWAITPAISLAALVLHYRYAPGFNDVLLGYVMLPLCLPYAFWDVITLAPDRIQGAVVNFPKLAAFWVPFIVLHLLFFFHRRTWQLGLLALVWLTAAFRWHFYALAFSGAMLNYVY